MDGELNLNIEEQEMVFDEEEEELCVFEEDVRQEPFQPIEDGHAQNHSIQDVEMVVEPETTKGTVDNDSVNTVNVQQDGKQCLQIIISNLNMPPIEWDVKNLGIEWRTLHLPSIFETTTEILRIIRDTVGQKKLIVQIYQKYAGCLARNVIEGELLKIFEQNREAGHHQLQVPTFYFVPEHCNIWSDIGELNVFIRQQTLLDNMGPFNLHRYLMKPLGGGYTLYSKGMMWEEYRTNVGLGRTLSAEGLAKIKKFVIEQFQTGFNGLNRQKSHQGVREVVPPALYLTPGWRTNSYMISILIGRGLAPEDCRERPASVNSTTLLSRRGRAPPVRVITRNDPMIDRIRASVAHRARLESEIAAPDTHMTSSSRTISRASTDEGLGYDSYMSQSQRGERNYNMRMEQDLEDLSKDVDRLRLDRDYWRNNCEKRFDAFETEIQGLQKDLEDRNKVVDDLENELEVTRYDNRELDDHVERLRADNEYLEDRMKKMKSELDRVTTQYDILVEICEAGKKKGHKRN